jgi:arylsulfatase
MHSSQPLGLITGIVYDLRTDPGETLDVKEKHPEIVNQLSQIADKYRKTIGIG